MENKTRKYVFLNNLPEFARNQLSFINKMKRLIILCTTFLVIFVLGFYLAQDKNLAQIPSQLQIEILIIFWAFILYVLNIIFIHITRQIKYEISWIEFSFYQLNNLIFLLGFIFLKNNVFGNIYEGINNLLSVNKALGSLRIFYFITFLILQFTILIYAFINRYRYWHSFAKTVIIFIANTFFTIVPWTLKNFDESFVLEKEYIFIIFFVISFSIYGIVIGSIAKIYSYGQNNQKNVNKVFFPLASQTILGGTLGILTRNIVENEFQVWQNNYVISSIVLSIGFFWIFIATFLLFNKKIKFDSFQNKLLIKLYVLINLLMALFILYLEPKFNNINFYKSTILIPLFPIIFITLMFLVCSYFKIITFERVPNLSNLSKFAICSIILLITGIFYTLEESLIIKNWLNRAIWAIFLTFYLTMEICSFIPDIVSVVLIKRNKKGVKNV